MAGELTTPYLTGKTVYLLVIDAGGQWWNGTAFEAYQDDDWASYAIASAELGTSGDYLSTFPASIPAGLYSIQAFPQAGDAPAVSDSASGPIALLPQFAWNGAIEAALSVPTDGGSDGPAAFNGLDQLYCTDEAISLRALKDYPILCPPDQRIASGSDGVFLSADRWTLTSASVDFAAQGVRSGHVLFLTKPVTSFTAPGELFAVDSVAANAVTLRRRGKPIGVGQPPAPSAGLTGVAFSILTFDPQIDVACFEANEFFGIDPLPVDGVRNPSQLYNPRELEQFIVLTVLRRAYSLENKAREGDFALKLASVVQDLTDLRSRLVLRWGTPAGGDSDQPQTAFGTTMRR